jgi:hypothetical protein
MNEATRKQLAEAAARHEACMRGIAGVHDQAEAVRRLVRIEREAWSESPVEAENRPLEYRHLLSLVDDLAAIEARYAACEHVHLREIAAQRYAEALGGITDMQRLMELAVRAHPDLRRLAILRFQQRLPEALYEVKPEAIPRWFTRLLMQPSEMSNFLSQTSCQAVVGKVHELLDSAASKA